MELSKKDLIDLFIIILILIDTILLLSTIFYDFTPRIENSISYFDLFVCIILFIEYTNNLQKADNKKSFVKSNWIDIIVMLPDILLNYVFLLLGLTNITWLIRLLRLIRVIRVVALFKKNIRLFTNFIKETRLDKLLTLVVIVIISSSVAFYFLETSNNFIDSLWYVLVTLTTLGYGDIVPHTPIGKILGILLIIIGIFVFSTLTGAISSIYTKKIEKDTLNELNERLDRLEEKLDKIIND